MHDTLTYAIGPAFGRSEPAVEPWFAVSGPAQQQTAQMAARIAELERKLAALQAVPPRVG